MDISKIKDLQNKIKLNKDKYGIEKDYKKKKVLKLKIMIDELKIRLERLK
jgi:hypothetical protein